MSQILYRKYLGEPDLPSIMDLVQSELSEPYVIYTFRYFLHHWSVFPRLHHLITRPHQKLPFPLQATPLFRRTSLRSITLSCVG